MADLCFEIEYVDRRTGGVVTKTVRTMKLAQKLAKELAIAHGHRAIIRRVRRTGWALYFADLETGELFRSDIVLSKAEAMVEWRLFKCRREATICVPWPTWAPQPTITFRLQRGA